MPKIHEHNADIISPNHDEGIKFKNNKRKTTVITIAAPNTLSIPG